MSKNSESTDSCSDLGGVLSAEASDRRREPRYPTDGRTEITVLQTGQTRNLEGRTVNVSKSGLRVRLPEPLEVGLKLRVKFGRVLAFGSVRWCRQLDNGYFDVGIRIGHTMAHSLVASVREAAEEAMLAEADEPTDSDQDAEE